MNTDDTVNDLDEKLITALGDLAAAAPGTLMDRLFAQWARVPGQLGEVFVAFSERGVQFLRTVDHVHGDAERFAQLYRDRFARPLRPATTLPTELRPALSGRPSRALRLDLTGLSVFERAVLAATQTIPAGQTRPYSWVASEAGSPQTVRAVGSVLARNPLPLLVPCHRVVRADGHIGDYIFGTAGKEQLLRGEDANLDEVEELTRRGVRYLASDTTGVVCYPTCRDARRITERHRRGFRTLAQAINAGYRPCQRCRPGTA